MPFAFLIVGAFFVVSGVRNTAPQLLSLMKGDLTGQSNYVSWMVAILAIGALGYVDTLRPLSRAFMVLVIVVLILKNGGVFQLFEQSINYSVAASNNTNVNQVSASTFQTNFNAATGLIDS
jgi:hypothetical protein